MIKQEPEDESVAALGWSSVKMLNFYAVCSCVLRELKMDKAGRTVCESCLVVLFESLHGREQSGRELKSGVSCAYLYTRS